MTQEEMDSLYAEAQRIENIIRGDVGVFYAVQRIAFNAASYAIRLEQQYKNIIIKYQYISEYVEVELNMRKPEDMTKKVEWFGNKGAKYSVNNDEIDTLYNQVKDFLLTTWSISCVTKDNGLNLHADNGNIYVFFQYHPGSNHYLHIIKIKPSAHSFSGRIENIDDFKRILELIW